MERYTFHKTFHGQRRAWAWATRVSGTAGRSARAGRRLTLSRRSFTLLPMRGRGGPPACRWSSGWCGGIRARSCRWPRRPATAKPPCCPSGPSATAGRSRGVGGRAGQRPEGPADLCRRGARCGGADRRAGVRRWPPGELGARLGRAAAGDGFAVDVLAGGAGPGRRARAAQRRSRAAVSVLADHVPDGSRLVLAGRDEPPLRMARLRAEGRAWRSAPVTCRSAARRRRCCCTRPGWRWVKGTWRSCTSGPRGGRGGCT